MTQAGALRLELLADAASIAEPWWALWHCDPEATPFNSPAWLLPWREAFPDGAGRVVAGWRGGRLALLLPLFSHEGRLLPWGAGTSDWLGGLAEPGLPSEALTDALSLPGEPVDLFQLPPDSPFLACASPAGWSDSRGTGESCPVLNLPAALPKSMRSNLRQAARRAGNAGVEARRAGPEALDALVRLHSRRWHTRGEGGIFADARVAEWLSAALPNLGAAGLLRFHVLMQQERIVAAVLVLSAKARAYYFIGGFDPDLAPLGLGTLSVGQAIAEAEKEGCQSFDFLRGREPYKFRWGAVDHWPATRLLLPPAREAAA